MGLQEQKDRKTVLIVDDTPENVDVLKGILSPHYRIQIATNGRIALKIANSPAQPDLILLDIMMPELDGYTTCKMLKANDQTSDIPILFVTAKSDIEDEAHGLSLGASDYLIKPVSPPIVLARVRTHLAIHDQRMLLKNQVEERTAQLKKRSEELMSTRIEVIRQLGRAAEYRDNETGMHINRMSHFARLLALKAGLSEPEAELIMYAAMMHDIGKIGIPDQILLKPGRLSADEFNEIKKHPEIGYNIIGEQDSELLRTGALIAHTHHEKWNGSGYPRGLKGEEIPLAGRITALADVFDALTSVRPYKKAWTVDDALGLIEREKGEHFDPELADLFLTMKNQIHEIMEKYRDEE